ncbi:NYN domain-containing protein [Bacillus sp. ISL-41]|uniref:NYN domain-containing protein n=1 Tax=Bacillus sp. ISL-41 TaxID=2819127 RepID=UPI001BE68738|nr:NYN domain-containing protein [Bacillus sp. ISL-41]MBT2644634.1 NYN domain-containing protein [Bacillus sp. ISL-41]
MSLSGEFLYVLPFLSEEEGDGVYRAFFKMVGNHQFVFRLAERRGGHSLIADPSYINAKMHEIVLLKETILPRESHEFLQVFIEAISPLDSIKNKAKLISYGENAFVNKQSIHRTIKSVNRYLIKEKSAAINRIPVLVIQSMEEYSLKNKHVSKMLHNQKWIRQLISFFQFITDIKVKADHRLKMDAFLFNKEGEIKQFFMYNLLDRSSAPGLEILLHNLKVFQALIQDFSGELYGSGSYREDQYNSDLNLLMIALDQNNYAFDDFREIAAFLDQQGRRSPKVEKVAVFLDTANIFTGLHTYNIDFSQLLTQVFGEKKNISDQYAAIFYPKDESESKTSYEKARRDEFKVSLEAQRFQVLTAENGTERAKVIENGREMDADDLKLIAKMRERMDKYTKILVLTGDKHFLPVMKEYEEKGVQVDVISIHPEDTSQEMVAHFKDRHHFITDYWESIII